MSTALTLVTNNTAVAPVRKVSMTGLKRALLRAADRLDSLDIPKGKRGHVDRLASAFEECAVALEAGDVAEAQAILAAVLGVEVELGVGKALVGPLAEQVKQLGASV